LVISGLSGEKSEIRNPKLGGNSKPEST